MYTGYCLIIGRQISLTYFNPFFLKPFGSEMSSKFWIYWVDVNTKFTAWQKEESIGHSDTTLKSFLRLASQYLDTMKSSDDLNKKCARHMNVLNPLIIQMLNLRDNKLQSVWQLETFFLFDNTMQYLLVFQREKAFQLFPSLISKNNYRYIQRCLKENNI